jgi:hypothetical protein
MNALFVFSPTFSILKLQAIVNCRIFGCAGKVWQTESSGICHLRPLLLPMQLLFFDLRLTHFLVCSLQNCLQQVTQVLNKCSHISSEKASVVTLPTCVQLKMCMQGRGGDLIEEEKVVTDDGWHSEIYVLLILLHMAAW